MPVVFSFQDIFRGEYSPNKCGIQRNCSFTQYTLEIVNINSNSVMKCGIGAWLLQIQDDIRVEDISRF